MAWGWISGADRRCGPPGNRRSVLRPRSARPTTGSAQFHPKRHSYRPEQDEERCHPVGAGMDAISLQRSGPNAPSHPDAVLGNHLVSDSANDCGSHHEAQVGDTLGVQEPIDSITSGAR